MDNVIQAWNTAARSYAEAAEISQYARFCRKFVTQYFSNVNKLKILDAGCGSGEYTHILSQNGAAVTGCDAASEMLRIAREKYPAYSYDEVNLTEPLPYEDDSFDLVFCHLVLMDIDPIDTAISEFYRITKEQGRFFFSIVHPAFYRGEWEVDEQGRAVSKKVPAYISLAATEQNFWGTTMHYHRPISYYFNQMTNKGFILKEMLEPKVYEEAKIPDMPLYLFAEFQKG